MLRRKKSSKILGPLKISHKRKNCAIVKPLKWKDIIDIGPSIQTNLRGTHSTTTTWNQKDEKTLMIEQEPEQGKSKRRPEQAQKGTKRVKDRRECDEREENALL